MTELVQITVSVSAAGVLVLLGLRSVLAFRDAASRKSYELTFPRDFTAKDALAVIGGFSGLLPPAWRRWLHLPAAVLEVRADRSGIRHVVCVPSGVAGFVTSQLWASGVRLREIEGSGPAPLERAVELRRVDARVPLATDEPEAIAAGMLAALQPLGSGEQAVIQWVLTAAARALVPDAGDLAPRQPWWRVLFGSSTRRSARQPLFLGTARDWQGEGALLAVVRVGVAAQTEGRRRQLLGQVLAGFHRTRGAAPSLRRRLLPSAVVVPRLMRGAQPIASWPCLVRVSELAAACAFPVGGPVLPGLTLGGCRLLAPAAGVPRQGRVLGEANFPGIERPIALGMREATRHLMVQGPTGVGKSTLLLHGILSDIASGAGVCVVDPKGDLVDDVLARLPAGRARDVILLDPAEAAYPVGFNLLAGAAEAPELVVDGLVAIFRDLARGSWGPRLEDTLRAALLTLAHDPGLTLCELDPLLGDPGFRRRLLTRLDDPVGLEPYWAAYEALSDAERGQWVGPVLNKVRAFTVRRHVRRVIGQAESSFRLPDVLDEGKILLVSLPKGLLGEDSARLLGAAVIGQLWQAVLGRAGMAPEARRPFFVYVDEWQDFVALPTSIGSALAQSRGMNVGWTLAGQHLHQVSAELREDALANAVSKICFQLGATDARLFAREFSPHLTADDLQGLGSYEAVFRPAVAGSVAPPLTMRTLPAPDETGHGEVARAHSRKTYGREAGAVDAAIRARLDGGPAEGPVKRRRRG